MTRRRAHSGFTLLELVLVMVIIAIALSIAAPKLRGWSRGRDLRDAADQFVNLTRYARAQAASDGQTYRLTIDSDKGTYQLTKLDGQRFVAVAFDFGEAQHVPDGYHIEIAQQASSVTPATSIDFFPSGRAQAAQVKITAPNGEVTQVICPTATDEFAVATGVTQ